MDSQYRGATAVIANGSAQTALALLMQAIQEDSRGWVTSASKRRDPFSHGPLRAGPVSLPGPKRQQLEERPASCCNHVRRTNVRKLLLTALCGIAMGVGVASAAEVVIKLKPPISVHETRGPAPSSKHVWIAGYHRWDGNAYVWEKGRWDVPPREHAVWVAPKYTHRHDGYVYTEGHWR